VCVCHWRSPERLAGLEDGDSCCRVGEFHQAGSKFDLVIDIGWFAVHFVVSSSGLLSTIGGHVRSLCVYTGIAICINEGWCGPTLSEPSCLWHKVEKYHCRCIGTFSCSCCEPMMGLA
jgi:hypothetical protein